MGAPTVCFEPHLSCNSIFDEASTVLISVKSVVGKVQQPVSDGCCVGVSFFQMLSLFAHTKTWEIMDGFLTEVRFFVSTKLYFENHS